MFHNLSAEIAQARKDHAGGALGSAQEHLAKARTLMDELLESVARAARPEAGDADALLAHGDALRLAAQYKKALPLLEGAVEQDPSAEALASMAATLGALGDYDRALEASEEAVQLAPEASFPRVVRGALLSDKGEVEEGLRELRQAVELNPEQPATRQALGRVLAKLGRLEEAVVELDRAIALVDSAVNVREIDSAAAEARLKEAQEELERLNSGESEADRWQVEQRIKAAENQLSAAGRS
jgi:tetratricopeptide (TPR) repeat protein